ncbi:MAG: hypothetical protein ACK2TX_00360 [Anaerolineales bacterium]|jgi:hypothetical protein
MNPLVESLGPVFIAGFALQQLLELLDPLLERWLKPHKAWLMSALAFTLGLGIALVLGLRVLASFGLTRAAWLDAVLTALLISSGTKWLNDLLKIISYKKQELQARATYQARQLED